MKTISIVLLALIAIDRSEEGTANRRRRDFDTYSLSENQLGTSIDSNDYSGNAPLQETELYSQGIDSFLPISHFNPVSIDFKVNLPPPPSQKSHQPIPLAVSNSVEKPVDEPQEYVPPQSITSAVIPLMIPPATPVNAAASNVPGDRGAVFLGSGSLGIVNLGNGAYALGSGSLGYSGNRAQTRPSAMVPVYPPLPATPNLIPAATPNFNAPPPPQPMGYQPTFDDPYFNFEQPASRDQNGYEMLPANSVRFGSPVVRPPRLRNTLSFATPSAVQMPSPFQPSSPPLQFQQQQQQFQVPQQQQQQQLYSLQSRF